MSKSGILGTLAVAAAAVGGIYLFYHKKTATEAGAAAGSSLPLQTLASKALQVGKALAAPATTAVASNLPGTVAGGAVVGGGVAASVTLGLTPLPAAGIGESAAVLAAAPAFPAAETGAGVLGGTGADISGSAGTALGGLSATGIGVIVAAVGSVLWGLFHAVPKQTAAQLEANLRAAKERDISDLKSNVEVFKASIQSKPISSVIAPTNVNIM